jgi:hypothetical protein
MPVLFVMIHRRRRGPGDRDATAGASVTVGSVELVHNTTVSSFAAVSVTVEASHDRAWGRCRGESHR